MVCICYHYNWSLREEYPSAQKTKHLPFKNSCKLLVIMNNSQSSRFQVYFLSIRGFLDLGQTPKMPLEGITREMPCLNCSRYDWPTPSFFLPFFLHSFLLFFHFLFFFPFTLILLSFFLPSLILNNELRFKETVLYLEWPMPPQNTYWI